MAVNIQNRLRAGYVTVSADFIYRYARDTEEFALYMYTLACMNEGKDFDVEAAGKCLDITSRKVVNGLKRLTEELQPSMVHRAVMVSSNSPPSVVSAANPVCSTL